MSGDPRFWLAAGFCAFGWLSSLSYPLHLVGPYLHSCEGGNALPYFASMIAGPITLLLASLLLSAAAALGVTARWPTWLHLGTLGAALYLLPDYLANTTVDGQFICASNAAGGPSDFETASWQRAWVPVHNAAIVAFGIFLVWYWRRAGVLPADVEPLQ